MVVPAEPSELSPDDRQQLRNAVLASFGSWETLEEMLLLRMNLRLASLVARDNMNLVIFNLLFNVMEARGELPNLVKAACRHAPSNRLLLDVATRLGWAPDAANTADEAATSVRTGLRAVAELLRDPAVSASLQAFRAVFDGADQRIHTVGDYKDLHDRLHDLQLRCYSPILSARRDFPQGETRDQLRLDAGTLNTLIRQLRAIVNRPTLDAADFPWIEDNLEVARVKLNAAIEDSSSSLLEMATAKLTEVMQLQPTLINSLLMRSVRDLDLPLLHTRLQEAHERLRALGADEKQLDWFIRGVADLQRLDKELKDQLNNHRSWQVVENNLRLVEAALTKPIEELEASWQTLQLKLAVVCKELKEYQEEIEETSKYLDEAIQHRKLSAIFRFFSKLQTLAGDRFYNVDKELKQLCEKLRPVGRELDTVILVMR